MAILDFIIWNGSPEIFTVKIPFLDTNLTVRWYGLLFALGFLVSQQLLYYIYKKEGKPERDVDTLTIYMVIATIIGARLGHVLFYEPERYFQHPIEILKVWKGGLASHGAAIAILIALFLYSRYFISLYKTEETPEAPADEKGEAKAKVKYGFFFYMRNNPGQSYRQVVDRIVILVALTGALIRLGNFFNSEIIGKPTQRDLGVMFARPITDAFMHEGMAENVSYVQVDTAKANENGNHLVKVLVDFKKEKDGEQVNNYLREQLRSLRESTHYSEFIDQSVFMPYKIGTDDDGHHYALINMYLVPRHPAQLYEAISCVLLFLLLFILWKRQKALLPPGRLLGVFLIVCFGLRFVYEFLKENQVLFENELTLNMGQILSIPMVILGVVILALSFRTSADDVNR